MNIPIKTKPFIYSPGRFFHYEILSTSFSRENLIILEAELFATDLKDYFIFDCSPFFPRAFKTAFFMISTGALIPVHNSN
jgi:hypothetical protein